MDRFTGIVLSAVAVLIGGCSQAVTPPATSSTTDNAAPTVASTELNATPENDTPALTLPEMPVDQGAETFEQLLVAAKGNQAAAWSAAEGKLQQLGPAAVPTYVKALASDDALAREMAVMLLVQLGPPPEEAVSGLTAVLADPSAFVRVNAATALSTLETPPPAALTTLTELMNDADVTIRVAAATSLGNIGPAAQPALTDLARGLTDPEATVRRATAASLGRLGAIAERYLTALQRLSDDEDEGVRQAVAMAVKQLDPALRETESTTIPASATQPAP